MNDKKNDANKANSLLDHWTSVLFCDAFGNIKSDTIDTIMTKSSDGFHVRTITLKSGDVIKVTVDYYHA